jgi:peptidoglycan/LPS O-acetylase OafA/YrhL
VPTSAPTLLANIALVHAWAPEAGFFFSYNAVSWSISTELGFYLFFPLLIVGFAKSWWWKLTGALALALGTIVVCKALNIPSYPHHGVVTMGIFEISPLGRIFEFVLGMTAALFWLSWLRHIRVPVVLGTVLEIGAIFFVFENVQLNSWPAPLAVQYGEPGVDWLFMSWTPALPSAFLIMVMASRVGWLGQWLSTKPLVFLGEISFSIYLTHHILLRAFVAAGLGSHLGTLAIPVYILSVLGLSTLIWLAVERPARAFIVRLWPKETGFAIRRAEAQVSVSAGVR